MRFLKIKDIGKVFSGATPKTDVKDYWDGNIPWVTPKEINKLDSQYLNDTERRITEIGLKSCSANILPKGSILFTSRAPIGLVAIADINVCTNQGFKSIVLNEGIDSLYIYYTLKYFIRELNDLGTGTTFKELSKSTFEKFEIPVPSYIEQVKVGTILRKTEALIKQRKDNIALLDEFLKSTFLKMFGDPERNNKGWEKNAVEKYTDCIVPGRDKPKSFSGTTPWFTTNDLIHKGFVVKSKNNLGLTNKEIKEVRAKIIPIGSVIMTCVGDLGTISINKEPCIVNQQLHTFQCHSEMNNVYLMHNLSFLKSFMYKMASTTTVAYMNKTICNSIPVLLPPLEKQNQFAEIAEKTELLKEQLKNSLNDLQNLFGSLSQKAFKGELDLSNLVIDENLLPKEVKSEKHSEKINPAILKALDAANSISKHFDKTNELSKAANRFNKYFEQWEKLNAPFNKLPKLPNELIEAQQRIEKIQSAFANVKPFKPNKSEKVLWEKVSTQQVSNWIKENYSGYHFTSEMLIRFLMAEHVTFPDYYSSEELKKFPQTNEADDLKSLIFSAVSQQNPYLKLEQVFYNAEEENIQIKITEEDYELIKERSPKNRSGIYFTIAE